MGHSACPSAGHGRRGGDVLADPLAPIGPTVDLAEPEVAVGGERPHTAGLGERQRLAAHRLGLLDMGAARVGLDGAELKQCGRLMPPRFRERDWCGPSPVLHGETERRLPMAAAVGELPEPAQNPHQPRL